MRATVETEALKKALDRVGLAADGKQTIPILGSIRIEAAGAHLVLASTNLELFIQDRIAAQVREVGIVIISYRLLRNFMARAEAKETTLGEIEGDFAIKHGENTGKFPSLGPDEWPDRLEEKAEPMECLAEDLSAPLRKVMHAVSQDEARYVLTGIGILPAKDEQTEFAATDARRLSIYRSKLPYTGRPIILPSGAAQVITKLIDSGKATVRIGDTMIAIRNDNLEIDARLIEGTFPNHRQVIPERSDNAFSVPRKELIGAVRTAAVFLSGAEISVTLAGRKNEVVVSCYDRFRTKLMGTELKGQPKEEVSFDYRFLLDSLEVCENDNVRIEIGDGRQPALICEGGLIEVVTQLVKPAVTEPVAA